MEKSSLFGIKTVREIEKLEEDRSVLDKAVIEEIRESLLAEKKKLIGGAVKTLSGLHAQVEAQPDFADQSATEMEQNFTLRLRERETKFVQKMDEALNRIEEGTFGICEKCEREIGIKRLLARPTVVLCIECKTEQERREKMLRGD